jgi:hypothetical protein
LAFEPAFAEASAGRPFSARLRRGFDGQALENAELAVAEDGHTPLSRYVRLRTYPGCVDMTLFNPKGVAAQMTFTRLRTPDAVEDR